jgi:hypothetical protein
MSHFLDKSGYQVFSSNADGDAHVMAHRMLDAGEFIRGHRLLKNWLAGRQGDGSRWVHLQFHMAVFEIAVGDWHAAHKRYLDEVLPVAAQGVEAITDAPQLAWRLAFAAPVDIDLHWETLRRSALVKTPGPADPWVEIHRLLALAGAGDFEGLAHFEHYEDRRNGPGSGRLVGDMAAILGAYVKHHYGQAGRMLEALVPRVREAGGSQAQNQLFELIAQACQSHRVLAA